MSAPARWPFAAWHRTAVQGFRLAPSEFWALPLADWLSLCTPTDPPMTRDRLADLMKGLEE